MVYSYGGDDCFCGSDEVMRCGGCKFGGWKDVALDCEKAFDGMYRACH